MAREMKCPSQKKSNAFSTIRADWGLPCFQSPADCPAVGRKLRDNVVRRALKDLKAWLLIFANAILHNSPAHLPPCPAEKVNHGIRRVREATKYDAGTHCPGGHLRSQSWHGFHPSASLHPSYLCEPFLGQTTSIFGVFGWFWHGMGEQKWSAESFAHILILKPCEFSTYGKRRGWIKRQGGRKHSEPQILLAARAAGREFQQIRPPSAIHCSVFRASNHTTVLGDQTVWVFFLCQLVAGPPVDLLPAGWSVHQLYPTREKIWREKSRWLRRGQNVGKHRRYPNPGGQIHNSFDPPMFDEVKWTEVQWSETSVTRKGPRSAQAWRKRRKLGTTTLTLCMFTRSGTESFAMFHRCLKNTTNKIAPENANFSFPNMKYLGSWQAMVSVKRCCAKDRPMIWGTRGVNIHFVRVLAHDSVPVFSAAKWRDQMLTFVCSMVGSLINSICLYWKPGCQLTSKINISNVEHKTWLFFHVIC